MNNIFELEKKTVIPKESSYIKSYPFLLSYFSEIEYFTEKNVICGTHMIYGWMPTMLDLYSERPNINAKEAAIILSNVRDSGNISDKDLSSLVRLINNSLVGSSKLLHFVAPNNFAIWDSKIFSFLFNKKPDNYNVSKIKYFRCYLNNLFKIREENKFEEFHKSVNVKIGYAVSDLRALELIMFLNAPVFSA